MLFLVCPATAAELSGIVTEVQDGDSLTLVNWQATAETRGADCYGRTLVSGANLTHVGYKGDAPAGRLRGIAVPRPILDKLISSEMQRWGRVIRERRIKPD